MIDTHHELVIALAEAAELEHSLICQYLFAAYSIKTDMVRDSITAGEKALFSGWRQDILSIAHQEMGHLGTVWNLSALVGASPNILRANFPQAAAKYYPPAIGFLLEPFGKASLDRFIDFEMPEPQLIELESLVPEPLVFKRVGDLYRQIRACVEMLPESELLKNTAGPQDSNSWANNVTLKTARTRAEILDAIDFIIVQGEGSPQSAAGSHFETFTRLRTALEAHSSTGGNGPARNVLSNPATQKHRDAPDSVLVSAPAAVKAMDLFGLIYSSTLHLLRQYYSFSTESADQRLFLRSAAYQCMHSCLGPLGANLGLIPAFTDGKPGNAGPSFEIYGFDFLSSDPPVSWSILAGRMRNAQTAAAELMTEAPEMSAIFERVARSAGNIAKSLEDGLNA